MYRQGSRPEYEELEMGSMIATASGPAILLPVHTTAATRVFNKNAARYKVSDVAALQQRPLLGQ